MTYVWLGLGTNLGDRLALLHSTILQLQYYLKIKRLSRVYESPPMYVSHQPWYLNMVVLGETKHTANVLLNLCKQIETSLGRVPSVRYGPRCIDIDILSIASQVIHTTGLIVPHPRLHERLFVLYPLQDVSPTWRHPLTGVSVAHMIREREQKTNDKSYLFVKGESLLWSRQVQLSKNRQF